MRKALRNNAGARKKFKGIFVKLGKKRNYFGYSEETVLLRDIVDVEQEKKVADHVWFSYTKNFQQLRMVEGSCVEFEARIKKYEKGYINSRYKIHNRTIDYKLSHPTKICLMDG